MTLDYIFQADIYCDDCAADIVETQLRGHTPGEDSDTYPQGPFSNGGGEADCPQHCGDCGVFLENPLTPDGDSYVREHVKLYESGKPGESWDDVAACAEACGNPTAADWIRFYLAPGQ